VGGPFLADPRRGTGRRRTLILLRAAGEGDREAVEGARARVNVDVQASHDRARDRWLESEGVRVLRFAASAVLDKEALPAVLAQIAAAVQPG
jgi:hypothetical protein